MTKINKTSSEDRGFYRFMSVIGIITIGGLCYAFFKAAPNLSMTKSHLEAKQPDDCLTCHIGDIENAPIIPHRPMQSCTSCHRKESD